VSFHHLGFWTDRLAESSHDLGAHGWPCAATVASPQNHPSRFTLQQSPHGFYVELVDTATPRHADLLPEPSGERTGDEHHYSSSPAVSIGTGVHVTNTPTKAFRVKPVDTTRSVAVGPKGYPVYTFQRETTQHLICQKTANAKTNCWGFWPPVSVKSSNSVSKQSGIDGKLGTFSNHGVRQITLNGQPLYYFTPDLASKNTTRATGDQIKTFGSIWHIVGAG
jgi:predicted lipoprotein with Yx(FWY)xxD motif